MGGFMPPLVGVAQLWDEKRLNAGLLKLHSLHQQTCQDHVDILVIR
jgi:hypothetical protein